VPDAPAKPSIAIISHMYPQASRPHLGVFVSEQVRALVRIGEPPIGVVVPVPSAPWPLPLLSPRWREYSEVERHRSDFDAVPVDFPRYLALPRKSLPGVSAASAVRAILLDRALKERIRSADVIVAHTALLDGGIARLLSRRYHVPYVAVVHGEDLYHQLRADSPPRMRDTVSAVLGSAATVVAVSSAVARGLADTPAVLKRLHVLHNGVDTMMFAPARPGARPGGAGLRTLTAGHLVERKANDLVLRAIASLEGRVSIEHTIAGDGPERTRLEALAAELGIADRVRFVGAYVHEDLPALLHDCDLFVMPSWDEAFGVVYLEAMACGVPVIAASDGGATDVVDDGRNGFLVPPRGVSAVADAIASFAATSPDSRARMRGAARTKAESFTWEANARGLVDVVREVLA
jgi:glycosyltransferase involved in cell wall biosynthesis